MCKTSFNRWKLVIPALFVIIAITTSRVTASPSSIRGDNPAGSPLPSLLEESPNPELITYLPTISQLKQCKSVDYYSNLTGSGLLCSLPGDVAITVRLNVSEKTLTQTDLDALVQNPLAVVNIPAIGEGSKAAEVTKDGKQIILVFFKGNAVVKMDMTNPKGKAPLSTGVEIAKMIEKLLPEKISAPAELAFPSELKKDDFSKYFKMLKVTIPKRGAESNAKPTNKFTPLSFICVTETPVKPSRDPWMVALYDVQKKVVIEKDYLEMKGYKHCGGLSPQYAEGEFKSGDQYELRFAVGETLVEVFPITTDNELKIGILVPMTGPVEQFGQPSQNGAMLAIEEWNNNGGVLGYKIVPVLGDSQSKPQTAIAAANKLIDEDQVGFIMGDVISVSAVAISEIVNAKKVVQVASTATQPAVTLSSAGKVKPFTFRAAFIEPYQSFAAAKFARETLSAKTVYLLVNQGNDYSKGLTANFEGAFKKGGGTVLGKSFYNPQDTSFSTILDTIAEKKPDLIYLPDNGKMVNLIKREANAKGIPTPFLGGASWPEVGDFDLAATDGDFFTTFFADDDPRPEASRFRDAYTSKYSAGPDAFAAYAYDATNLILQGIKAAGVDDPDKVRLALEKIVYTGATGEIRFDAFHNPIVPVVVNMIKDGKIQYNTAVAP